MAKAKTIGGKIVRAVDTVTVLRFVKLVSTPFTKWPAYKQGVIDENGNTIKRKQERTTEEEKASFTLFHRLARNVKRLISKIPFGGSILGSFAAAMFLIRESQMNPFGRNLQERWEDFIQNDEQFIRESYELFSQQLSQLNESNNGFLTEEYRTTPKGYRFRSEKSPYDSQDRDITLDDGTQFTLTKVRVGRGGGRNWVIRNPDPDAKSKTIPGVSKAKLGAAVDQYIAQLNESVTTSAVQGASFPVDMEYKPDSFMGIKVFDVDTERYMKSKNGKRKYTKYSSYVGNDETGEQIRQFGRQNPKSGIILRDSKSGSMIFLRKPQIPQ